MKTLLIFLLTAPFLIAAEPTRKEGLSVHMLPDRVAQISGGHGGFTVTTPDKQRGDTYPDAKTLLQYFTHSPASVQQNGIWIVTTDPSSYTEAEESKLRDLISVCNEKNIPIYTCRAIDLPNGWKRAK